MTSFSLTRTEPLLPKVTMTFFVPLLRRILAPFTGSASPERIMSAYAAVG